MCSYFQADEFGNLFEIPQIIIRGGKIWSIIKETIAVLPASNHEKTDYMLVFRARISNDEAVIVEEDTEVFLSLIYAFLNQLKSFFISRGIWTLILSSSLKSK